MNLFYRGPALPTPKGSLERQNSRSSVQWDILVCVHIGLLSGHVWQSATVEHRDSFVSLWAREWLRIQQQ